MQWLLYLPAGLNVEKAYVMLTLCVLCVS